MTDEDFCATATEAQLCAELTTMAARWRERPWESNDGPEGVRYNGIRDALEGRFNVKLRIEAVPAGSTNYQVV